MCHQSVGLIQSAIEQVGIPTASITLLKEITRRVDPPRALFVDQPLGYPLGRPFDAAEHRRVILAALDLLQETDLPLIRDYTGGAASRRPAS